MLNGGLRFQVAENANLRDQSRSAATMAELARIHTTLDEDQLAHLQRLVRSGVPGKPEDERRRQKPASQDHFVIE